MRIVGVKVYPPEEYRSGEGVLQCRFFRFGIHTVPQCTDYITGVFGPTSQGDKENLVSRSSVVGDPAMIPHSTPPTPPWLPGTASATASLPGFAIQHLLLVLLVVRLAACNYHLLLLHHTVECHGIQIGSGFSSAMTAPGAV